MQAPWVGKQYGQIANSFNGTKILVVGESHYADEDSVGHSVPGITVEVVEKYKTGEYNIPFFTRIITMLTGIPAAESDWNTIRDKWDELAFYNYVPVIAASAPREFDWSLWELGTDEYNAVLDQLAPEIIIVCGYRLWDNAYIRHTDGSVKDEVKAGIEVTTIHGDRKIPTLVTMHPSAPGFSGLQRYPMFKALYDKVQEKA